MAESGDSVTSASSSGDAAEAARLKQRVLDAFATFEATAEDFQNPRQEWRRLVSELLGTFFLVLVAAGGGMMGQAFPGTISRTAAVVAPGLMVLAIILFMGKVSGAHLNPAVSVAFSLRGDFPWRRVPGYVIVQLGGAALACWFLQAVVHVSAIYGSNYPAAHFSAGDAFWMEAVLTFGLVSVILGTASGAQNLGVIGALGVGAYIALAGLWGSPISGASMNPARTFGPDLVGADFTSYWVYVAGPLAGACVAVGMAFVLRGRGGGKSGSGAAQGALFTEAAESGEASDLRAPAEPHRTSKKAAEALAPIAHLDVAERAARGKAARKQAPRASLAAWDRRPIVPIPSRSSAARKSRGSPSWCRSGTSACSRRRSRSTAAPRS